MMALVIGANYSRKDAVEYLAGLESFFRDEFMYGPAGAAHAAAEALRTGASRAEIREQLRSTIAVYRCLRPSTRFDFVSSRGNMKGGFAVIARILFGVLRHEA